ncbi:MAG: DUF3343 domain-containing protein [Proteobacteria bacterium]|nr:DUF3343 domain-containing protein [Pseudomonadota bacterium]MBU2228440.1 DUF3343 domain-containing protein [Pseudomonadota bacterium]MBU2262301.1 DUF3343 domain-containing protein [Pseudomonadota bacterium]
MADNQPSSVVLVESFGHALQAEKMLGAAGIPCRLVPVPRHISSDCGVCLRFSSDFHTRVEEILSGRLESFEIVRL